TPDVRLHDHAGPAAVGRVVDGAVAVGGDLAQVVHVDLEQAVLDRLAQQGLSQRREVLGKDGDDAEVHGRLLVRDTGGSVAVGEHAVRWVDHQVPGVEVDRGNEGADERNQFVLGAG